MPRRDTQIFTLVVLGAFGLAHLGETFYWPALAVTGLTALGATLRGARPAQSIGVLLFLVLGFEAVPWLHDTWPLPVYCALFLHAMVAWRLGWVTLPSAVGRTHVRGKLAGAAAFVIVAPPVALAVYLWGSGTDVERLLVRVPAGYSVAGLLLLGWLFSVLNALAEESVFRGIVLRELQRTFRSDWWMVGVQAVAFGLMHYIGFPDGWEGVVLAGGYGAMLGALRLRSDGLLLPVIAHALADVVVVTYVITEYLAR